MPASTLTSKGQITLPKQVREQLRVGTGDTVEFVIGTDGEVRVLASRGDVSDLRGLLHRPGRKAVSVEQMHEAISKATRRS
jgi:AbrB family looped-hinge helix DNA binding protein